MKRKVLRRKPRSSLRDGVQVRNTIEFRVLGIPEAQGSARAFIVKGRPIITTTNKNLNDWRRLVAYCAQEAMNGQPMSEGPAAVSLEFNIPKPKSAPKKREVLPHKRPDLDKLVRAALDAMSGIAFQDDAQVVDITATKRYGTPGVHIRIEQLDGEW